MTPPSKPVTAQSPQTWRQSASTAFPAVPVPDRLGWLRSLLLLVWAISSFGLMYFARHLQMRLGAWPVSFWLAAQGIVLGFVVVVFAYAFLANRAERASAASPQGHDERV